MSSDLNDLLNQVEAGEGPDEFDGLDSGDKPEENDLIDEDESDDDQ